MEVDQISILEFIYEKDTSSQWVSQILSMGSRKCSKQCTDFQLVYSMQVWQH